jgi:hypothetical protein
VKDLPMAKPEHSTKHLTGTSQKHQGHEKQGRTETPDSPEAPKTLN